MQRLPALLLALGLAACSGLPLNAVAPTLSVADVSLRHFDPLEQRFDVGLKVENPNDFELTVEALEVDLEVNGRPFARGMSRAATRIPAAATTLMRIDAVTQTNDLIRQIKTLPGALKDGVPYRIRGRVKTDRSSGWLPFDHAGVYGREGKTQAGRALSGPRRLRLSLPARAV
jgi:LEA14-like dessication related protein